LSDLPLSICCRSLGEEGSFPAFCLFYLAKEAGLSSIFCHLVIALASPSWLSLLLARVQAQGHAHSSVIFTSIEFPSTSW
jgi:hypothetical protein